MTDVGRCFANAQQDKGVAVSRTSYLVILSEAKNLVVPIAGDASLTLSMTSWRGFTAFSMTSLLCHSERSEESRCTDCRRCFADAQHDRCREMLRCAQHDKGVAVSKTLLLVILSEAKNLRDASLTLSMTAVERCFAIAQHDRRALSRTGGRALSRTCKETLRRGAKNFRKISSKRCPKPRLWYESCIYIGWKA
jgi:hypothetical protein